MSKHKDAAPSNSKREQLRQQQIEAAQKATRKRIITLSVIAVAVIALVAAVLWVVLRQNDDTPPVNPGTQIAPPNASTDGYSIVVGSPNEGALVIDVHSDYQCPACSTYEQYFGDALHELATRGDIELRFHMRTMVGDWIVRNDSSLRASTAAACADTVGMFYELHSTIYANQPPEGVGYSDEQLRSTFPEQAGITGDNLTKFQQCYDDRQTSDWVQASEDEGWNHVIEGYDNYATGIHSTPTFLANNIPANGALVDLGESGVSITADSVLAALQSAAGQR